MPPSLPTPPPAPRALPGAHMLAMVRRPLEFLPRIAREAGDVVTWRMGAERLALVSDPELIRGILVTNQRNFRKGRGLERAKLLLGEGLLTSEGEFHLRQRRLAQPAFHRDRIAGYGAAMVQHAARLADRWRDGETIDITAAMARLTLAIVGQTLFATNVEHEAAEIADALTVSLAAFAFAVLPFGEILERLPLPPVRRFYHARARLDAVIYRIIAERRASGEDRGDLLSMLMLSRDSDDGAAMSDRQLRDEAMTLFLAGHETTANALAWTWYLLAHNSAAEAALHAELAAVLGDREPTVDDLPRLAYTRMVVAESMRLFPPAWVIGRRAIDDYEAGGYRIPARTIVLMSQWVVHRDARHFPDPERFEPERWSAERSSSRHRFAYFPFGGGTRQCIGEQFAWMEATLLVATLARRWRFRLEPGQQIVPKPMVTLRPGEMRMRVGARSEERGASG